MLHYLMLHNFNDALDAVALFNVTLFLLFDVALFNVALILLHYLMLCYVNVPLFDVAL